MDTGTPAYSISFDGDLLSLNVERKKGGRFKRQESTAYWRDNISLVASRCPKLRRVGLVIRVAQARGTVLSDAANYYSSIKAAIDGLVIAGLVPDDSPEFIAWKLFMAPTRNVGRPYSTLTIEAVDLGGDE